MKIKNIAIIMATIVCAIATPLVTSSCSSSDEPDDKPVTDRVVTSVDFTYTLVFNADMLAAYNISITYTDGSDMGTTETVTSSNWTRTVHARQVPATFIHTVSLTPKPGINPNREYTLLTDIEYVYNALNKHGQTVVSKEHSGSVATYNLKGEYIPERVNLLSNWLSEKYVVDANGDVKQGFY